MEHICIRRGWRRYNKTLVTLVQIDITLNNESIRQLIDICGDRVAWRDRLAEYGVTHEGTTRPSVPDDDDNDDDDDDDVGGAVTSCAGISSTVLVCNVSSKQIYPVSVQLRFSGRVN